MLEDMKAYLARKAEQLGLDRADKLAEVQEYLDELYPGQCRAVSLNNGVLKIATQNASVASELRFKKGQIIIVFPGIIGKIIILIK